MKNLIFVIFVCTIIIVSVSYSDLLNEYNKVRGDEFVGLIILYNNLFQNEGFLHAVLVFILAITVCFAFGAISYKNYRVENKTEENK